MTPAEFIAAAQSFPVGSITVVSAPDLTTLTSFLNDTVKPAVETPSKTVLVFNSRATMFFTGRDFREDVNEGRIWEYMSLLIEGSSVILVANEFDPDDRRQNRRPISRNIDVFLDLFRASSVEGLTLGYSRKHGITRELWPFITNIYFYDQGTDEIDLIKTQIPERP